MQEANTDASVEFSPTNLEHSHRIITTQAYVDLVRKLVDFVKKMDPRVKRRKQEVEEIERSRASVERARLEKKKMERQRRRMQASGGGNEEEVDEEMERMLDFDFDHYCPVAPSGDTNADDGEGVGSGTEGTGEEQRMERKPSMDGGADRRAAAAPSEDLYCIVCKKRFKSAKQWHNHEKSKKHLELVARLQKALLEDESAVGDAEAKGSLGVEGVRNTPPVLKSEPVSTEAASTDLSHEFERHTRLDDVESGGEAFPTGNVCESEGEDGDSDDDAILRRMIEKHSAEGDGRAVDTLADAEGEDGEGEASAADSGVGGTPSDDERDNAPIRKPKKARRRKKNADALSSSECPSSSSNFRDRFKSSSGGTQRRAPRAGSAPDDESLSCKVCGMDFSSRTQLFKHIKKTGHAALKS